METIYCRLCAEPNTADTVLECDDSKRSEIHIKLNFLNASYVNIFSPDSLPKTICFICYDSLNKAYDFLDKVKKAQDKLKILTTIFPLDDPSRFDLSDDDRSAFEALFGENHDVSEIKQEITSPVKDGLDIPPTEVKLEPKEEADSSLLQENFCQNITNSQINIQEILDSAVNKTNEPLPKRNKTAKFAKTKSWKEFVWTCAFCSIEFTDVDVLRSHSKVTHNKCAAFMCVYCKTYVKTDDFNAFVKHTRKHNKELSNRCHYCDEIVEENLISHVKQHVTNNIPCLACGELLPDEESLRQHLSDYIAVKQKRKPRRKAGMPITVEDLTCHICKKVYKNKNSLRDHIKRHTSDRKRNYTCDRCGKTFFNKGTLTTHIMAHEQVRPHICRICNKSFVFPNMLRRHVEMHSGVKPFSCEICGRCFRLQYQLNAHKIVHTDSMPHVCQYCNKAFRFKQILKNHERQHTGAKPYNCQHCCMEFSNWSNYNKHMKRRHNLDTSKKKITPEGVFPINPATGQIIQIDVQGMEEWKSKVMIPAKRGKKKKEYIKVESAGV